MHSLINHPYCTIVFSVGWVRCPTNGNEATSGDKDNEDVCGRSGPRACGTDGSRAHDGRCQGSAVLRTGLREALRRVGTRRRQQVRGCAQGLQRSGAPDVQPDPRDQQRQGSASVPEQPSAQEPGVTPSRQGRKQARPQRSGLLLFKERDVARD